MPQGLSNIDIIKQLVAKTLNLPVGEIEIDYPPNVLWGDFSVPCFNLSKKLSLPATDIAKKFADVFQNSDDVKKMVKSVSAIGPYFNIALNEAALLAEIQSSVNTVSWRDLAPKRTTMVEFLSPNTNKPLHLGHLRNAALGEAIANILKAVGQKVIKVNLINDRGIHIAKSMLAWQKWAKSKTPRSAGIKGDHFVGELYVRFNQELLKDPNLINEAQIMLKKWEEGDTKIWRLWRKMNKWVLSGFKETLKRLGVKFDKVYFESKTYKSGKDIVQSGLKTGVFVKQNDGNIVYFLPPQEFGLDQNNQPKLVVLQRADGTSVYITQDLGLGVKRTNDYRLDRLIYVVGSEQDYHFKCLFAVFKALGYKWAENCYHLSYGMVNLPSGKMKSRTGQVVDADDLMKEMAEIAATLLREKNPGILEKDVKSRAEIIGLGAMRFFLLASSPKNAIKYDPAASISLDGMTATYCQYAAVRANNILLNAKKKKIKFNNSFIKNNNINGTFGQAERLLAQKLLQLPKQIQKSAATLDPSILARHVYEISQAFNQFYQTSRVLEESQNVFSIKIKLALVKAAFAAIAEGLSLLGIKTPFKM